MAKQDEKSQESESPRFIAGTLAEVAEFFGRSVQTIKLWRGAGMPGESRRWDLAEITRWRLEQVKPGSNDPRKELAMWKSKREELRYKRESGELVTQAHYERSLGEWFGWFKTVMLMMGQQLAPRLAAKPQRECRNVLDAHTREVLKAAFGEVGDKRPISRKDKNSVGQRAAKRKTKGRRSVNNGGARA